MARSSPLCWFRDKDAAVFAEFLGRWPVLGSPAASKAAAARCFGGERAKTLQKDAAVAHGNEARITACSVRIWAGAMFTLRPYLETDVETVVAIWWKSWHSIEENLRHPHAFSDWRSRWVLEISVSQVIAVVEDHDGAVVAFAAASLESKELSQLFVRPDQKRRGIGTLLVNWAKARMPDGFRLSTLERNQASRTFYLDQGFVEGETRTSGVNEMVQARLRRICKRARSASAAAGPSAP